MKLILKLSLNLVLKSYHYILALNTSIKFFVKSHVSFALRTVLIPYSLTFLFTHYQETFFFNHNIDSRP